MSNDTLTADALQPATPLPEVRKIGFSDLADSLRAGFDDFLNKPSHVFFLGIIYPVLGLVLARLTFGYGILPILFPLAAGFALLGPIAAIGFYEISRRREQGLDTSWWTVFQLVRSRSRTAILILSLALLAIFIAWIITAQVIYTNVFGGTTPSSIGNFIDQILYTPQGERLMIVGNAVGFLFALASFMISVISFPLLVDRDVSAPVAVVTSLKAVVKNPVVMVAWAVFITLAMIVGSLPFLLGLIFVLPILGHASWHLYRRVVV